MSLQESPKKYFHAFLRYRNRLARMDREALLERFLAEYSKKLDVDFSLAGERLLPKDAGTQRCLLPIIAWHADQIFQSTYQRPSNWVTFSETKDTLSGFRANVIFSNSDVLPIIFAAEALSDIVESAPRCDVHIGAVNLDFMIPFMQQSLAAKPATALTNS